MGVSVKRGLWLRDGYSLFSLKPYNKKRAGCASLPEEHPCSFAEHILRLSGPVCQYPKEAFCLVGHVYMF
jgi:hypothetical protein